MMKHLMTTCTLILALCCQSVFAEELTLGSKAPKLEVKKFIKGEPVKGFEKGKIYVVEMWATWCGPCLESIPHLTHLQKEYKDVTFIGIAVLEQDQDAVPAFVEKMDEKMDYRVALDLVPDEGEPDEGKTVKNWMEPAELNGIPSAFVINGEGKVAWIGHPAAMDEPLAQIVAGKWDLVAEAKKLADAKLLQAKMEAIFKNLNDLFQKFNEDEDPKELVAALDSAAKEVPDQAVRFQLMKVKIQSVKQSDAALATIKELLDSEMGENAQMLDSIAWIIVDPDRDSKADPKLIKLALKLAQKADNLTNSESPSVSDTLAKAYFDNGDLAKAVSTQEHAMELAEGKRIAADPNLRKRLRQYRRALEAASSKDKEKEEAPAKPTSKK